MIFSLSLSLSPCYFPGGGGLWEIMFVMCTLLLNKKCHKENVAGGGGGVPMHHLPLRSIHTLKFNFKLLIHTFEKLYIHEYID